MQVKLIDAMKMKRSIRLLVVGGVILTLTFLCSVANAQGRVKEAKNLRTIAEFNPSTFVRSKPVPPRPPVVPSSALVGLYGQITGPQSVLGPKGSTAVTIINHDLRSQRLTFHPTVSQFIPLKSAITEERLEKVFSILRDLAFLKLRSIQDGMTVEERNAEFNRLHKSEFDDYLRFVFGEITTPNEIKKKVDNYIEEKTKQISELEKTSRTSQPVKAEQGDDLVPPNIERTIETPTISVEKVMEQMFKKGMQFDFLKEDEVGYIIINSISESYEYKLDAA